MQTRVTRVTRANSDATRNLPLQRTTATKVCHSACCAVVLARRRRHTPLYDMNPAYTARRFFPVFGTFARPTRPHQAPTNHTSCAQPRSPHVPSPPLALTGIAALIAALSVSQHLNADAEASLYPSSSISQSSAYDADHPPLSAARSNLAADSPASAQNFSPNSPHAALLTDVRNADPHAIHTLSQLLARSDGQSALQNDVIPSLVVALSSSLRLGEQARPAQLTIVRLLADLAENSPLNQHFADPQLALVLSLLLAAIVALTTESWSEWLSRQFTFSSKPNSKPQAEDPVLDTAYLPALEPVGLAPSQQTVEPDLDAGIAFHTLRCVSNLARHSNLHEAILSAPVLPNLCQILVNLHLRLSYSSFLEHDLDLFRFALISVSALAKSAAAEITKLGAHVPLIQTMHQSDDVLSQSYAAGGVRNLARHPAEKDPKKKKDACRVHRDLIVAGAAGGLTAAMGATASNQTKSFAALAFADIMSTEHEKAHIIQKRMSSVFPAYVNMLRDRDTLVFRSMCRSLSVLFERPATEGQPASSLNELSKLVSEAIEPLSQSAFNRLDVIALKTVRAMCSKESIARSLAERGTIDYAIRNLREGRGEVWDECTAVLAELSQWEDICATIVKRGGLKAVLGRPSPTRDGFWATKLLANVTRDAERDMQAAHGGVGLLLRAVASKDGEVVREGARGLHNLSLGGVSKMIIISSGGVMALVKTAGCEDHLARRYAVGALAEISECTEYATKLVEADVIDVLLRCAKEDEEVARDVARCVAQLSQVAEVHGMLAKSGAVEWLADRLKRNGGRGELSGEVMQYATTGLCNLAYSGGGPREAVRETGIVRTLVALTSSGMGAPFVVHVAKQALANLRNPDKAALMRTDDIAKNASRK